MPRSTIAQGAVLPAAVVRRAQPEAAQNERSVDSGGFVRLEASIIGWRPKSAQHSQNARVEHFGRASRNKAVHKKVGDALMVAGWPRELPDGRQYTLTFRVEQHRGTLPDSDNQIATLKSARDAVARWLRTTDSVRGPIEWRYIYRRGPADRVVMVLEEAVP